MCKKKYIITAALPYANGPIHIGHMSGVYIPADIFVRYLRTKQKQVIFICGSDEYGAPIKIKAWQKNITPISIVNKYHKMIKDHFKLFNISFDNYSRTSKIIHHKTARKFFKNLVNKYMIKEIATHQYYDEKIKEFLADRYIIGTCKNCNYKYAYGDLCEKCGSYINPEELINPKSVITNNKIILKKTNNWFLLINKYQSFITTWIENKKNILKNNVYSQTKSWLHEPLQPRAITRDMDWGIPLSNTISNKVLYVWFEAPIGYISSTKEWAIKNKKDWKLFWKNPETSLIQFIGKDNIVFHCIIFPIMLAAYNNNYILPENIIANSFLNLEGNKISTSQKWAVWLHEFIKDFPNQEDELRYYLTVIMPEKKDSNFKWQEFKNKINNELIAILGNFINRVITLCHKYLNSTFPIIINTLKKYNTTLNKIDEISNNIETLISKYEFRQAIKSFIKLSRIGNKFLSEEQPWNINNENNIQAIIFISIQIIIKITKYSYIFLPNTYTKLIKIFNINTKNIFTKKSNNLFYSNKIIHQHLLFKKITNKSIQIQIRKLNKLHKS
jgi:methionyl-tRNA synthetase